MRTVIKEVQGIDWFNGAVMNCLWKGPRLRDVLQQAGIQASLFDENAASAPKGHVEFACYEQQVQEDSWYGGSISLKRAIDADADVILALGMNGERLNAEHGAPVRVVVPGVAGARSVKWLSKITVQEEDSKNFYQQHDYKILPPEATDREVAEKYWSKVDPMMDMPVNSIIGMPDSGETIRISSDGRVEVRGYAVPHGRDGPVRKVEVSGDGGKTWIEADLEFGGYGDLSTEANAKKVRWAWCLWSAKVEVSQGPHRRIVSRATDSKGNTQQEQSEWNLRGVGYNGWGSADELAIV
jgi:sulfite oxidase